MANSIIKYDVNTPAGRQLQSAILELQSAWDRLQKLAAILAQADAAATPAVIETAGAAGDLFGVEAGKGAAFTTAVTGLASGLNAANRAQMALLFR